MPNEKTTKSEAQIDLELAEEITSDVSNPGLVPQMNVNVPAVPAAEEPKKDLIADEKLLSVYDEVLENIRNDRKEIDTMIATFAEMVVNEGDATSSSKEALVNLYKIKHDTSDKLAKIADLMTRVKLKEKDTFPKYLANHQSNTFNITKKAALTPAEKRALIEQESQKNKDGGI